jgi:hypothetical protein
VAAGGYVRLEADRPLRPASSDELLFLLHARARQLGRLARVAMQRRPSSRAAGPASAVDIDPDHPIYGCYLAEWMEGNRPEPGFALTGLLRSCLGEMRAAISSRGGGAAP